MGTSLKFHVKTSNIRKVHTFILDPLQSMSGWRMECFTGTYTSVLTGFILFTHYDSHWAYFLKALVVFKTIPINFLNTSAIINPRKIKHLKVSGIVTPKQIKLSKAAVSVNIDDRKFAQTDTQKVCKS